MGVEVQRSGELSMPAEVGVHVMYTDASRQGYALGQNAVVDEIFNEHRIRDIKRDSMLANFKCMVCKPTGSFESKRALYEHLFDERVHRQLFKQFVIGLNKHNN